MRETLLLFIVLTKYCSSSCLFCPVLSSFSTPYNMSHALSLYQYLKRARQNFVTMHHIGGWGKTVRDRLAPTLESRLASHAHYLKRGRFVEKVRNVAQFKPSSLLEW